MKQLREHDFNKHGLPRIKAKPVAWQRVGQIRLAVEAYWHRHNPNAPLVWSAAEEKAARELVQRTRLCGLDFGKLVLNRELTLGTDHTKRPAKWIGSLANFVHTPSPVEQVNA